MDTIRVSVDVEAGGGDPHDRALLEIGLSVVGDENNFFEVLFKPDPKEFDRHALHAIRRPISEFMERGVELTIGINQMLDWIDEVSSEKKSNSLDSICRMTGCSLKFAWQK